MSDQQGSRFYRDDCGECVEEAREDAQEMIGARGFPGITSSGPQTLEELMGPADPLKPTRGHAPVLPAMPEYD